jgi:LCP family protein required for cell wall assembly
MNTQQTMPTKPKKRKVILIVLGVILLVTLLLYLFWLRPKVRQPISEALDLPTLAPEVKDPDAPLGEPIDVPSNLPEVPVFVRPTKNPQVKPICGDDLSWTFLLVGIDYRGEGYLYGLADIIRLVEIDFVEMTVNMVALPRDLLVEVPDGRFTVQDPFKINQAYLFGTPGMNHYLGSGGGAGSLAEAIQYNFGVTVDHYGVINFVTFAEIIDAIGGIEVDLPGPVYDEYIGSFPAGPQTLDGWDALALARIRRGYNDSFRVSNQTIILRAILKKMANPAMILKVPELLDQFSDGFLTDLSINQLSSLGVCSLRKFDTSNLQSFEAPLELLTAGRAYIPTLSGNAFVYRWDEEYVEWIHDSLVAGSE